jgi:hypothetical protein
VTLIEVTNTNWLDVVVYSARFGERWRLGMVRSMTTETFRLPRRHQLSPGLRLVADPVGSSNVFVTERIAASPGDRVMLTVAPQLAQSYFAIYP